MSLSELIIVLTLSGILWWYFKLDCIIIVLQCCATMNYLHFS